MRQSRMQYRATVEPTGSVVQPVSSGGGAVATSSGRPGLVLLALLILGMGAFAYWTK